MSRSLLVYQAVLACVAALLFGLAIPHGVGNVVAVVGLATVAAVAERGRVRLDSDFWVTISVLPTVFAAAVFGPLAAMLVAG